MSHKPYIKLGVRHSQEGYPEQQITFGRIWRHVSNSGDETDAYAARHLDYWDCACHLNSTSSLIAEAYYLEGAWANAIVWARRVGDALSYYYFGDWTARTTHDDGLIDVGRWFRVESMMWTVYLDMDLAWVAVGRHWDFVDKILEFPTQEILADDQGPAARAYYLGLARWWRDRADVAGLEEAKSTRGAGAKMYHLLADIALGITNRDERGLATAFPKCVEHFMKRRDHDEQWPMSATFLWNVAKRDGLQVSLPEEAACYLFEIPDEAFCQEED